jgi:cyclase
MRLYELRDVDELVLLDIGASSGAIYAPPDTEYIRRISDAAFYPLTIGGGIASLETAREVLAAGADKVSIGTAAAQRPSVVREIADAVGSQSVVVSVDVKRDKRGTYKVYARGGKQKTKWNLLKYVETVIEYGAGEILLQAIDREGTFTGYDLDLIRAVSDISTVPIIASGGAYVPDDLIDAIAAGADAVAGGAIFQFTNNTPRTLAAALVREGIPVRG